MKFLFPCKFSRHWEEKFDKTILNILFRGWVWGRGRTPLFLIIYRSRAPGMHIFNDNKNETFLKNSGFWSFHAQTWNFWTMIINKWELLKKNFLYKLFPLNFTKFEISSLKIFTAKIFQKYFYSMHDLFLKLALNVIKNSSSSSSSSRVFHIAKSHRIHWLPPFPKCRKRGPCLWKKFKIFSLGELFVYQMMGLGG